MPCNWKTKKFVQKRRNIGLNIHLLFFLLWPNTILSSYPLSSSPPQKVAKTIAVHCIPLDSCPGLAPGLHICAQVYAGAWWALFRPEAARVTTLWQTLSLCKFILPGVQLDGPVDKGTCCPSLITWVWSLGPRWWKERINLFSDFHTYTMAHVPPSHIIKSLLLLTSVILSSYLPSWQFHVLSDTRTCGRMNIRINWAMHFMWIVTSLLPIMNEDRSFCSLLEIGQGIGQ